MRCRLTVAMVALGCLGLIAWAVWPKSPTPPSWAIEYDVAARPPESIAPGTVIGRTAPDGLVASDHQEPAPGSAQRDRKHPQEPARRAFSDGANGVVDVHGVCCRCSGRTAR